MKKYLILIVFFLPLILFAKQKMDFELYRLGEGNYSDFNKVSKQFAAVMAPVFLGEASTGGVEGFEIGLGYNYAKINAGNNYWQNALNDTPIKEGIPNFYSGLDLHIKKGLPFGFKIFGDTRYYLYSEMMSGNFGFEYALSEGFIDYPDFSLGTSYSRLYGATDLNMSMYEIRAKLSKIFPLAYELKFIPSIAYSFLNVSASSNRLGGFYDMSDYANQNGTPAYEPNTPESLRGDAFYFKKQVFNIHRFALGIKLTRGYFALNIEGILPLGTYGVYNFNTGLSFVF